MKIFSLALAAALLTLSVSAPVEAAACRDAKGKFVKCPDKPKAGVRCKDAKGKFANCGTPGQADRMSAEDSIEDRALDLNRTHGNDAWFHATQAADAAIAARDDDRGRLWTAVLKRIAALERMTSDSLIQ